MNNETKNNCAATIWASVPAVFAAAVFGPEGHNVVRFILNLMF